MEKSEKTFKNFNYLPQLDVKTVIRLFTKAIKGYNEKGGLTLNQGGGHMSVIISDSPNGRVCVSENVVKDIVKSAAKFIEGVEKVKKINISIYKEEMIVNLLIICGNNAFVKKSIEDIQNSLKIQIRKRLGISVSRVNVTI